MNELNQQIIQLKNSNIQKDNILSKNIIEINNLETFKSKYSNDLCEQESILANYLKNSEQKIQQLENYNNQKE